MRTPVPVPFRLAALAALWASLAATGVPAAAQISDPTLQTVRSAGGVVASASVFATEAGARILAEGGNAVDAAVAAAFALAVTEPSMSGLGGRASIVVRTPDGRVHGIDGLNQVPRGYRPDVAPPGYDRAAVPGVPAALGRLHREHGSLPLERVLAPAIRLAEEGFVLPEPEADRFASAADDLREIGAGARGTYLLDDGSSPEAGTLFRQPYLAAVLRAIGQEGVDVFYRGWIADSIDADMRRAGGFVTREELAAYEALPALPVQGTYRGYGVVSNFRPASGHSVIEALHILEALDPAGTELSDRGPDGEARWAALVGQAMGLAIADRNREGSSEEEVARLLTSVPFARERARDVVVPPRTGAGAPDHDASEAAASDRGARLPPDARLAARPARGPTREPRPGTLVTAPTDREATTHLSAADGAGMVVALTQSLGPSMGTRLVAPGLGFLYATRLGTEPGSRPSSTIAPTILLDHRDAPVLALGGAGDARIISAVIQVLSRVVDRGMTLEEAVAAPRVHPDGPLTLRIEDGPLAGWPNSVRERLESWDLSLVPSPSGYFGRVHAVAPLALDGSVLGVAEPRWNGGAAGPDPHQPAALPAGGPRGR